MKNTTVTYLLLLVLGATICRGQDDKSPDNTTNSKLKAGNAAGRNGYRFYFPPEAFQDRRRKGVDSFLNNWYSTDLQALKEPVIYDDESQNEIYRFTWVRSFHNPVAIRIERHDDTYVLYWKVCDGRGGYQPGKLVTDRQKAISKSDWDEFLIRLNKMDFWNISTQQENFGTDGAQWILEGKTANRYHVTDRWSPKRRDDNYYQCCNFLIELTGMDIKNSDKY